MRTRVHPPMAARRGFTLVEVMVAAGLCVLIMTVMATAFQAGMDTLSQLKSAGELQQRLRAAELIVRRDLQAEHLESPFGNKVSDQRMDVWPLTGPGGVPVWQPPPRGFFRVVQEGERPVPGEPTFPSLPWPGPTASLPMSTGAPVVLTAGVTNMGGSPTRIEAIDNDGVPSTRATGHVLHMTVKLPGTRADQTFFTSVPAGTMNTNPFNFGALGHAQMLGGNTQLPTRMAEVVYFLHTTTLNGTSAQTGTTPTGVPTYTLYRRVRGILEQDVFRPPAAPTAFTAANFADWSQQIGTGLMNVSHAPRDPNANDSTKAWQTRGMRMVNGPEAVVDPNNRLGGVTTTRTPIAAANPASGLANVPDAIDCLQPTRGPDTAVPANFTVPTGEDVLLSNVISFEIKLNWDGNPVLGIPGPGTRQLLSTGAAAFALNNTDVGGVLAFDDLPVVAGGPQDNNPLFARMNQTDVGPTGVRFGTPIPTSPGNQVGKRVFDTWFKFEPQLPSGTPQTQPLHGRWDQRSLDLDGDKVFETPNPHFVPLPIRVRAIQIKIRIWDAKNNTARQVTITENL